MNHMITDDSGYNPASPYHQKVKPVDTTVECWGCANRFERYQLHDVIAYKGQIIYRPCFCDLCLEEYENGKNPLFKQTKEASL